MLGKTAATFVSLLIASFASSPAQAQDLPAEVKNVFTKHCVTCHSADAKSVKAKAKVPDILDVPDLIRRGFIVAGNPAKSILFSQIETDTMPEGASFNEREAVATDDKLLVKNWIASLGTETTVARTFISDGQLLGYIFDDVSNVSPSRAKDYRYLTITHLYNNIDLSNDDLDRSREAISKMVNSLSWRRSIVKPVPIDPEKTIYRLNLQQLGWSPEKWDKLANSNPYAKFYDTIVSDAVATAINSSRPHMRADWFIEKVSQPPHYHDFADIPATVQELERKLLDGKTADEALTSNPFDVVRAGFSQGNSGVSLQNRMIERHHTAYGAYWRSFDFARVDPAKPETAKTRDFFSSPTGPGAINGLAGVPTFEPDGGEIIFNLPNGLQAYMLVTGTGERIDKGPIEIVQDDTSFQQTGSREIINGISCIACHAGGMRDSKQSSISKTTDELLNHVQSAGFPSQVREYVETLHRPDDMKDLWTQDVTRFLESLERIGVPRSSASVSAEPVSLVVERFRRKVNMRAAATELGFPEEKFIKAMEAKERSSASLGSIVTRLRQGGIPREEFIVAFAELREAVNVSGESFETTREKAETAMAQAASLVSDFEKLTNDHGILSRFYTSVNEILKNAKSVGCFSGPSSDNRFAGFFGANSNISMTGSDKFTLKYLNESSCIVEMKYQSGDIVYYSQAFDCVASGIGLNPESSTCKIIDLLKETDVR